MMEIIGKIREAQSRMHAVQKELSALQASGEAGGGMVSATVNGKKTLVRVEIAPEIIRTEDKTLLQDLIVAAVNKAMQEAEAAAKEKLSKATEGLIPNIPGIDFSNWMG